ncbi:hypothetical protein SLE2022_277370 [Rubroshorea leprosula]
MPGNEVGNRICNQFELENSLQGQNLLQAVDVSWPVLNSNQWVRQQGEVGALLNFNLKSYSLQQLDSGGGIGAESLSIPPKEISKQLTPIPEYSRVPFSKHHLITNGLSPACQDFGTQQNQQGISGEHTTYVQHNLTSGGSFILKSHQENESCDSPTLTTNSERSEITEASTDFNFLKGQDQIFSRQLVDISQPLPMQQSGYPDMQLLQRHIMLKQLQDLQRQGQLQQLGDVRQQNTLNQLSAITRQPTGNQMSPLINGTPVHDASSQMFMNLVQRGASPTTPGISKRVVFSQEQAQALRPMSLTTQQDDASLYGTPVANARGNMSQYSHLQGMSNDTVNLFTKAGGQTQKSMMQSSGAFLRDQSAVPPDQLYLQQGAFMPNQGFQGKEIFRSASLQGFNNGTISGNFQVGNTPQMDAAAKDFSGRQERDGWPVMQQKTTHIAPQGLVPLDPIEEKILYNMDDNFWDSSFGRRPEFGAGNFSNTLDNPDFSNAFPSIQSGSWSALMQSAVAEASSSDTGLQDEWSGLTFQNTEQSNDNQLSNFIDSEKQQAGWVDNNLQSASSFTSKPMHVFSDSGVSSSFPGFQQPSNQFSTEHRDNSCQEGSSEQKSPRVTSEWVDCGTQQKQYMEGSLQIQSNMHMGNTWAGQIYEHPDSDANQRTTSSDDFGQQSSKPKGNINEAVYEGRDADGLLWKTNSNYGVSSRSTSGVEKMQLGIDNNLINREDLQINNNQSTCQQGYGNNTSDYLENADISATKENESFGKIQNRISNGPHGFNSPFLGDGDIYVKQERSYKREAPSDSYNSKGLSIHDRRHSGQGHIPVEELHSRGGIKSVGADGSNIASHTSQHMHELLQKVDYLREGGTAAHAALTDSHTLSKVPEAETHASAGQLYNQSFGSQGFGLRLAPPSQRVPNSSVFLASEGSPQTISYLNSGQVNSELQGKHQNELSQRGHLDSKSSMPTGISSYLNMQGSSVAAFESSLSHLRNQSQMPHMPNSPIASQNSHATLSSTASRHPPFNLATLQDSSQQTSTNPFGQQFPVLDAMSVTQPSLLSGMSRQGEFSATQNVWTSLPSQQHLSDLESIKVPSFPSPMNPSDIGINLLAGGYGEMQAVKERSLQQTSSEKINSSEQAVLSQGKEISQHHSSDANALPSVSSVSHSIQERLDGIRHDENHVSFISERDLAPSGQSLKQTSNVQQNYSRLHQVQGMNNAETDPSKGTHNAQQVTSVMSEQLYEHDSSLRNPMDNQTSSSGVDTKLLSFFSGGMEDPSAKALSQPTVHNVPSHEMFRFGQNVSQGQSTVNNFMTAHANHAQNNLQMASWFKQYGTFRNGQMLSMSDARIANPSAGQFSLGKPSQDMHIHASPQQVNAVDTSQVASGRQSTATALVASEYRSASYVLPSDMSNQSIGIARPKKRKALTSEPLPWHKEVAKSSPMHPNISISEQEWAVAANRFFEKVEDEVEMLEDIHPMFRSKRRLILTTQLMQLLFNPAPWSILSTDATSHYDSVSYIASRLALGDACSLSYGVGNALQLPSDNSNMISEKEKLKSFGKTTDQKYSEVMEGFISRAKKLENDFQRMDKTASVIDIRVECQELERFAVINRFAKFHIRGQADNSGAASSTVCSACHMHVNGLCSSKQERTRERNKISIYSGNRKFIEQKIHKAEEASMIMTKLYTPFYFL